MNTFLIATDFSVTALHAATYICKLSKQLKPKRIIFYHALDDVSSERILITDLLVPTTETIDAEKQEATIKLETLINSLKTFINSSITLEIQCSNQTLIKGINDLIIKENIDLVAIGISGKGNENKNIIGSNTLKLMQDCAAPVLVIPSKVDFKHITNVMLAWDHKDTKKTLPVNKLTIFLQALLAKLYVVYIDNNSYQTAADILEESRDLRELLEELTPEVHSPKQRSITDGLLQFVDEHNVDIMIIVPKKASLLEEFFKQRSTTKIALRTEIPMLFIKKQL